MVPTILELLAAKRAGKAITIKIPRGQVSLKTYCESWKTLKATDPKREIGNWEWYPMKAAAILHEIARGVQDRINQRGGLQIREMKEARVRFQLERRVKHNCEWCGSALERYAPKWDRFCDAGCRRSYRGR